MQILLEDTNIVLYFIVVIPFPCDLYAFTTTTIQFTNSSAAIHVLLCGKQNVNILM